MTPAKQAKALGAKSLLEVSAAYGLHNSSLEKIHRTDHERFDRMVKIHVMAKEMMVNTQSLNFMLESVVSSLKNTNAAEYFIDKEEARVELTRAYVADFRVRMNDMCQQLLLNEQSKSDFREVVYNLLKDSTNDS